ncbi:recombinase family protein [Polaribacter aestuariivivens]|uniref:recombinase family protein n=1 Tax=Polaribacter aestuariivivens TaxID=2304626 RepID=UPI003F493657
MKKFIAYYRVSTQKQGKSGLGLQAQKNAVETHTDNKGFIFSEFTEIETGTRKKKRKEIYKAIELAKKEKATLIVAKLDRLSRDVEFTSALFNGGIDFICCDNPEANKLTIQILSVIAENEAVTISKRIKDALKVKKDKISKGIYTNKDGSQMKMIDGKFRLGNPNGFGNFQKMGVEKIKENAKCNKANIQAKSIIDSARKENLTYQQIANKLNDLQYTTRNGKQFHAMQVQRLYQKT